MSIAARRHRLKLCKQEDVVVSGGGFELRRQEVTTVWAEVEEKKSSTFSPHGAVMADSRNQRTHCVYIRYSYLMNLSVMAWLYEERLKSSPRWFKILKVGQTEMKGTPYFKLDVRLVERADDIAEPRRDSGPATPLPDGVAL